jgi:hypothetical protein
MEYLLGLSDLGTSATPDAFAITFEGPHADTIMIGQIRSTVYLIDPSGQRIGAVRVARRPAG